MTKTELRRRLVEMGYEKVESMYYTYRLVDAQLGHYLIYVVIWDISPHIKIYHSTSSEFEMDSLFLVDKKRFTVKDWSGLLKEAINATKFVECHESIDIS